VRSLPFDGARRELAVAKQMDLTLADVVRSKLIRGTVEVRRERFHSVHVGANSMWGVVTTLELIQHPQDVTGISSLCPKP
jgi:hypothetical protein